MPDAYGFLQLYTALCAAAAGLCFGSFANVVIHRVPNGGSIIKPPSYCPLCKKRLRPGDLIPVLSWLLLLGKCRYCRERISIRYPAAEFICAVLFAGTALHTGLSFSVIPLCLLAFTLLCIAFCDFDTREIPDGLIIFGTIVAVIWVAAQMFWDLDAPAWHDSLLGTVSGALPLLIIDGLTLLILKKDGFGFGDVKLMAMAGLFLGWRLTLTALFFAVVSGGVFSAFLLITKRAQKGAYIAFAPFLAAGIVLALWFGEHFLNFAGF